VVQDASGCLLVRDANWVHATFALTIATWQDHYAMRTADSTTRSEILAAPDPPARPDRLAGSSS